MREISEHILDIAQNSIVANANEIDILVMANSGMDTLAITIEDNGKGMSEAFLENVFSPFSTSRTTRKVGLGIPMFKETAVASNGSLDITSTLGKGACVTANMQLSHIDRPPLGALADTLHVLITSNPNLDFLVTMTCDRKTQTLSTKQLRAVLQDVSLDNPDVSIWVRENLKEISETVFGGKNI